MSSPKHRYMEIIFTPTLLQIVSNNGFNHLQLFFDCHCVKLTVRDLIVDISYCWLIGYILALNGIL